MGSQCMEEYDGYNICVRAIDRIRARVRPVRNTPAAQALLVETARNGVLWELPTEADLPILAIWALEVKG